MARPRGIRLDKADVRIVKEIQKDASRSIDEIAKILVINASTLRNRVSRLVADGYISYSISVNSSKSSWKYISMMLISLKENDHNITERLYNILEKIPNVTMIDETAGEYDFVIRVEAYDVAEHNEIRDDILKTGLVDRTLTYMVNKSHKSYLLPFEAVFEGLMLDL